MEYLTNQQEAIRDIAREFAKNQVAPIAKKLDETGEFPWDLVKKCAELKFFGVIVPEEYGGLGADDVSLSLIIEEIAKECASLALIIDVHNLLGCTPILLEGTEEQKQKYLIPAAKGEKLIAFGLTEVKAGSDPAGGKTTAVLDGNEWVINGSKRFITNADAAEIYIIAVKTESEKGPRISTFIIEKGTPGFDTVNIEQKMGFNNSNTGQLIFNNVRIPKENMLGKLNKGFPICLKALDEGRIGVGAIGVGLAQGAFDRAVNYAKKREQFGKPICKNQVIAFYLADMATEIELARTLLYKTARLRDAGKPFSKEAAMTKLYAAEMCSRVCDRAVQIYGGNGYMVDVGIERLYRDARMLSIGKGTSEIQKVIISGHVLA